MSAERDVNRIVRSWIKTEEHESADRVLQTVLSRLDTTPQRRSWWPSRRSNPLNIYAKLAAAAAAVLLVAVVGYQLIPRGPGFGSATPSPAPSATPQATEVPRLPGSGALQAGTYQLGTGPTFLVTVPSGWVSVDGTSLRKNVDRPDELALHTFPAEVLVFADACESEGTTEEIGPTSEDLIAALEAQANSKISDPVDVTVAGLPGKRFEISAPAGLDLQGCSIESLQIWVDVTQSNYLAGIGGSEVATAYVADTPEGRLLLVPNPGAGTPGDVAELNAIVASIQVAGPTPTASP